ncbi:secreted RxLR effector protein 161-like [Lactuca sativa]|uniref:secreted RxLR effector protein 161-like n=1 Tax=Lactuca sativa TaxID=4236 RepID=UPI001C68EF90|nr:secreted RxLR effector protein 161-like [Lactuca sativa]
MEDYNSSQYPMDEKREPVNATLYRRLVGSLRYLVHTRPDISYNIRVMSRYMQYPKHNHYAVVKHILKYVKGTTEHGLVYRKGGDGKLIGYSDSSYSNDRGDGRGTTRVAYYYLGNLITWTSQKQKTVALSSCEAEYIAATAAACQGLWLRNLFSDLVGKKSQKVKLFIDNQSTIALIKNPIFHGRSKHIDTKYHFIRMCVEREQIQVEHVSGDQQKDNVLTKAMPRIKFAKMRALIGAEDMKKKGQP